MNQSKNIVHTSVSGVHVLTSIFYRRMGENRGRSSSQHREARQDVERMIALSDTHVTCVGMEVTFSVFFG